MNLQSKRLRCAALLCFALAMQAHAADGPSFNCAHVTSQVNRTICASPELSALDRQLAEHYRMLLDQSGAEAPALQREQAQWLREVRNPCPDAACIEQAYAVWDAVLVARSRRLAGTVAPPGAPAAAPPVAAPAAGSVRVPAQAPTRPPAPAPARPPAPAPVPVPVPVPAPAPASAPTPPPRPATIPPPSTATASETRPFAIDPTLFADARALRGHACAPGEDVPRDAGYVPVPGSLPIFAKGSVVLVRRRFDADFAFLLDTRRGACRMVDVVSLPPPSQGGRLLQCQVPSGDASGVPLSAGIGLRRPGQDVPLAYWEVDIAHGQFIREPLGVLDWTGRLQCRQPEIGDGLAIPE